MREARVCIRDLSPSTMKISAATLELLDSMSGVFEMFAAGYASILPFFVITTSVMLVGKAVGSGNDTLRWGRGGLSLSALGSEAICSKFDVLIVKTT